MLWGMSKSRMLHDLLDGIFTGNNRSLWQPLYQRLTHANSPIRVVTHVFGSDCFHCICNSLIFPRLFACFEIVIEPLPTDIKHPAVKSQFAFLRAVASLKRNETHPHVLADFRRLAAKKALASSRNSFSSLSRLFSFASSLTCLRSSTSSSFIVNARA